MNLGFDGGAIPEDVSSAVAPVHARFAAALSGSPAPPPTAQPPSVAPATEQVAPQAAPEATPAAPPIEPLAPNEIPTPTEQAVPPTPPTDPAAPAAPAAPDAPVPATPPAFVDADTVAAAVSRTGLSPTDIQTLFRTTPEAQRAQLLARLGISAPQPAQPPPPPAPPDPALLDQQIQTYLTSRDPEGSRIYSDFQAHSAALTSLAPAISAAQLAVRNAEGRVAAVASDDFDDTVRSEARTALLTAQLELRNLEADRLIRTNTIAQLERAYQQRYDSLHSYAQQRHAAALAAYQQQQQQASEMASYSASFTSEVASNVDRVFSTLNLDPSFKDSPNTFNFKDAVKTALYEALADRSRGDRPLSSQEITSIITSLGPAFKARVDATHRGFSRTYVTAAQQRAAVPGPAPGIPAVAPPEAVKPTEYTAANIGELMEAKRLELAQRLSAARIAH